MAASTLSPLQQLIGKDIGTDHYLLIPAWYDEAGQRNLLPPEITQYIINSLVTAFAGSLLAMLKTPAKQAGLATGKWISDKLSGLLGSKQKSPEVSDEQVEKSIAELKEVLPDTKDAAERQKVAEQALAHALKQGFSFTEAKAAQLASAVARGVSGAL